MNRNVVLTCSGAMLLIALLLTGGFAEAEGRSPEQVIQTLGGQTTINRATGVADFVSFPIGRGVSVGGATQFLTQYGNLYGITDANRQLTLTEIKTDKLGYQRTAYQQIHVDVPVWGGILYVHEKDGLVTASNGIFIPDIAVNTIPTISARHAASLASAMVPQPHQPTNLFGQPIDYSPLITNNLSVQKNELVIYRTGLAQGIRGINHLAYAIEIRGDSVREFLFVDAHNGKILDQWSGNFSALDRELYETSIFVPNRVWKEGDALPGSLDQWQNSEVVIAGDSYNFFFNAFGRDSYDANGAMMVTINNSPAIICPNATWDGTSANFCTGTASDDVVAHEWAHAYTEYTNNLIYAWQAGALNEAYSDIWGETIDLLNTTGLTPGDTGDNIPRTGCNSSLRWQVGEDATAFGGNIRDMWNPNCAGDPGKVSDTQYECTTFDFGGVHINSGIPNHVYALLVDGGTYNGQTVSAIGLTKAAHIFWRAQSVYLTLTSGFPTFGDAIEQSCTDLIGTNLEGLSVTSTPAGLSGEIITAADCQEVADAALATEVANVPTQCNFQTMLDPNTPALTCPSAPPNILFEEDFESGLNGFSVSNVPSNPATWDDKDWVATTALPGGRAGQAAFGIDPIIGDCQSDLENGVIYMTSPVIQLQSTQSSPFLVFDHYVAMENLWDGGILEMSVNGGAFVQVPASAFTFNPYNNSLNAAFQGNDNPLAGADAFTGTDGGSVSGSWGTSQIDLLQAGAYYYDQVQFRWALGSDGCNGLDGWYVDNVQVSSCLTVPTAVSLQQPHSDSVAARLTITLVMLFMVMVLVSFVTLGRDPKPN